MIFVEVRVDGKRGERGEGGAGGLESVASTKKNNNKKREPAYGPGPTISKTAIVDSNFEFAVVEG
jgi:hypothetical protein